MSALIGIDFGTTQTKAAALDPAGKPSMIPNARGDDVTPTVLLHPKSGPNLIGTDAEEQGVLEPARVTRNFKLKLGSDEKLMATLAARDAVAAFVRAWKPALEAHLGFDVDEAVVTCPADFRDDQKKDLIEGFAQAGVQVARLLPEPTAAGMAYALEKGTRDARILVYDLGGGTFDVSILQIKGAQIDVLWTEGVRELGGNDFSAALRELVLKEVPKARNLNDPLAQFDLHQRIERGKISLATQREVPIVIGQSIVKVTQAQYHTAIDPLIDKTLKACDAAVQAAQLAYGDIDSVIMVGGASRPPYVQQRVAAHVGQIPKTDIDPEKAIAYGAAHAALAHMAQQGRTATIRGQVIPAPEVFVREITAHDVGCAVAEKNGSGSHLVNAVIIPKGTAIPCRRVDRFRLEHEQQTAARIAILQGEAQGRYDDCLLIGELELENLPKESKRSERIQVEYVIDGNGMVTATVTDQVSGQQKSVSIEYRKGIAQSGKRACA